MEFVSVNMDTWYYRISVACGMTERRCEDNLNSISRHLRLCGPLHLVCPGDVANVCTNIQQVAQEEEEEEDDTSHGAMWGCGLTSWMVCNIDKVHDIRERNVTIRSEIWTTNIRALGFRDTREWVTLWRLILRSLGCMSKRMLELLHTIGWVACSTLLLNC